MALHNSTETADSIRFHHLVYKNGAFEDDKATEWHLKGLNASMS